MENNQQNYKKPSKSTHNSNIAIDNTFFKKEDIDTIIKKLKNKHYEDAIERNNLILDLIRYKEPISKYELAKICNMGYNTIKQICKWLEGGDFIHVTRAISENDIPVKLISTRKINEVKDETDG